MTIEFQTPKGQIKEWVLMYLMRKLIEFHTRDEQISRAQVYLREQDGGLKSCVIDVTIFGDSLFVSRTASSYEEAALFVLTEMDEKLKVIKEQPPTEILTTVRA